MSTANSNGPFDLSSSPIHLGHPSEPAVPQPGFGFDGPAFQAYVDTYTSDDDPGRLVMVETTPDDWGAWECHTRGDELVIVLSGTAEFIQELDGGQTRIPVTAGSAVLNPKGVWHTADVTEPLTAIYITPCRGTEHRGR